jgi:hypothetical protein
MIGGDADDEDAAGLESGTGTELESDGIVDDKEDEEDEDEDEDDEADEDEDDEENESGLNL